MTDFKSFLFTWWMPMSCTRETDRCWFNNTSPGVQYAGRRTGCTDLRNMCYRGICLFLHSSITLQTVEVVSRVSRENEVWGNATRSSPSEELHSNLSSKEQLGNDFISCCDPCTDILAGGSLSGHIAASLQVNLKDNMKLKFTVLIMVLLCKIHWQVWESAEGFFNETYKNVLILCWAYNFFSLSSAVDFCPFIKLCMHCIKWW